MIKRLAITAGLFAALATGPSIHPVQAAEGGVLDYFPGAPGPFVGTFPPVPGFFLLSQNFLLPTGHLNGPDGNRSPVPVSAHTQGQADRFIISYPDTVFGAKFFQQVILPIVNLNVNTPAGHAHDLGISNVIISPYILTWPIAEKQFFTTGLDIATKLSDFDSNKALDVGLNYTSFQPVFAYRYLDPNGLTVGASARFLFNTTNSVTSYNSGATFSSDFDVGYRLGGYEFGVVGGYARQLADDKQFGVAVSGGNRYESLGLGPSITKEFGPVVVNVNYQFGVLAKNTVKSDVAWLNLIIPLYTPNGPPGPPPVAGPGAISSRF